MSVMDSAPPVPGTLVWMFILGHNLHYGLFTTGKETLDEATDAMIDRMASLTRLEPETEALDVGCGIGNPAFYLHEKTGCRITGISISSRGIAIAGKKSRDLGVSDRVAFLQRDALATGLPDRSFDIAWIMESSHLMRDKPGLVAETDRVLRPGGCVLLCDLVLKQAFSVADLYRYREDLAMLEQSFGDAKMESLEFYQAAFAARGFSRIESHDISQEAMPTLQRWKENLARNQSSLAACFADEAMENFSRSCSILTRFFRDNRLGYGIIKAVKPQ